MPVVPRYKENQDHLSPIPGVRVSAGASEEAFGAGPSARRLQSATSAALDTASKLVQFERAKADEVIDTDTTAQLSALGTQVELNVQQLRGRDAAGAPDQALIEWTKGTEAIKKSLSTPRQREQFRRRSADRYGQLQRSVQVHTAGQMREYDDQSTASLMTNLHTEAANNYLDEERVYHLMMEERRVLTQYASRNGKGEDWLAEKTAEAISGTHADIVTRMVSDGQFDIAGQYILKNAKELPADLDAKLKKMVESGRTHTEELRKAQQEVNRRALYLRTLPDTKDRLTFSELNTLASSEAIDSADYKFLSERLSNVNNDPAISNEDKAAKLLELTTRFTKLKHEGLGQSAKLSEGKLLRPAKGNKFQPLEEFRQLVAESAPYLTEHEERRFYTYTQQDYDASQVAKASILEDFTQFVSRLAGPIGQAASQLIGKLMDHMNPQVPVEKMAEQAAVLKDQAVRAANPRRSQYYFDQVITNANGLQAKVVGFDERGDPILELKRK